MYRWADHGAEAEFDLPLHELLAGQDEPPRKRPEREEELGNTGSQATHAHGAVDPPAAVVSHTSVEVGDVLAQAPEENGCTAFDLEMVAAAEAAESHKLG